MMNIEKEKEQILYNHMRNGNFLIILNNFNKYSNKNCSF